MDVVQFKDEFNVELVGGTNNKSVPYSVSKSMANQLIALSGLGISKLFCILFKVALTCLV